MRERHDSMKDEMEELSLFSFYLPCLLSSLDMACDGDREPVLRFPFSHLLILPASGYSLHLRPGVREGTRWWTDFPFPLSIYFISRIFANTRP